MKIEQKPRFKKTVKKLRKNQKQDLKKAIETIAANPETGQQKKDDLAGMRVHKFKMAKQLTLLAYRYEDGLLTLIGLGPHENFYRDLKR